jgi:Transglycosylase-like domain
MSGTDHPPSTNGPAGSTSARRALWSSLAAVAVVVGPISIASAAHGPETAGAAEPPTTIAELHEESRLMRAQVEGFPILADIETVAEAVAPPTTAAPPTTVPPTTTTAPPPPPPAAVAPVATGSGYNDPNNPAAWDRLAQCESGGNWAADTGNGYYGGIQFSLASWHGVGGTGYPHQASRETQIAMGQRLWHQGGWSHWPACTSKLGYR